MSTTSNATATPGSTNDRHKRRHVRTGDEIISKYVGEYGVRVGPASDASEFESDDFLTEQALVTNSPTPQSENGGEGR